MSQTGQQTGGYTLYFILYTLYFILYTLYCGKHCDQPASLILISQEFSRLCPSDRAVLLGSNLSLVAILTTASMFPLHMQWTMQLSPLLGELEVEKLDTKLRSLNVTGIDNLHLDYTQFFPVQCSSDLERERLLRLINNIGSWHQVLPALLYLSICPLLLLA